MTLSFSDGMKVKTDGKLKIIREHDGLYVTGRGMMVPADSIAEAQEIMKMLSEKVKGKK